VSRPKFQYIRNGAILEACRELPCQHCGAQDGTVVSAHSNQSKHGKGRGIKASDIYVAALCARCHSSLDQGYHLDKQQKVDMWDKAHAKTVTALKTMGKWSIKGDDQ